MPITSSGQIALIADIEAEFDQTGTTNISLFQARDDAGLTAGEVQMTDFYGLSDVVAPTVVTNSSTSVGSSSMTIRGDVTSDGGGSITERGFYFGTSTNATSNTKYTVSGTTGAFSRSMTGLSGGTTYRVFAFATNSAGTTIGSMVTQATSTPALTSVTSFTTVNSFNGAPLPFTGYSFQTRTTGTNSSGGTVNANLNTAAQFPYIGWQGSLQTVNSVSRSLPAGNIGNNDATGNCSGTNNAVYITFTRSGYSGFSHYIKAHKP